MDSKSGRSWRACGYSNIALRDAGASTRLADRNGRTPLELARGRGYVEMVRLIEAAGR